MTPTSDRQAVLDKSREAFGREIDGRDAVDKHGGYTLTNDGGMVMFVLAGDKTYKMTAGFKDGWRGQSAIDGINAAYAWLFENTDAERVICYIDPADKACLALNPYIFGATVTKLDGTMLGENTRQRWEAARPKS